MNHYVLILIGPDDAAALIETRVSIDCIEQQSRAVDSGWLLKLEFGWQAKQLLAIRTVAC